MSTLCREMQKKSLTRRKNPALGPKYRGKPWFFESEENSITLPEFILSFHVAYVNSNRLMGLRETFLS